MFKQALYGHNSIETARLVEDYPYGGYRTQIRFWVERHAKKGARFCSQTLNPKTQRWNNPKKGTYHLLGVELYLDENDHVKPEILHEYSKPSEVQAYLEHFPESPDLLVVKVWVKKKIQYLQGCISGQVFFTINGVKQPWKPEETERHKEELAQWEKIAL
jgi:hypothetical protein